MLTSAKFYAQRLLGIRKNIDFADSSSATLQTVISDDMTLSSQRQSDSGPPSAAIPNANLRTEFRSFVESAISGGWYMLEISGTLQIMGSNVTLRGLKPGYDEEVWSDLAHVQLGSHQSTKRLVHLTSDVEEICVHIDDDVDFKSAPVLTLIRVTAAFAKSRMGNKLKHNSSYNHNGGELDLQKQDENDSDSELLSLYENYQRLMERHVNPVDYNEWLDRRANDSVEGTHDPSLVSNYAGTPMPDSLEHELTIQLSAADMSMSTQATNDMQMVGKTSGLLGNPSLSVFLTGYSVAGALLDSVCAAVTRLIDNFQCELKIIVPSGISNECLQELATAHPSIVEIFYFDASADCAVIDACFMELASDLQVFVSGETLVREDCFLQFYRAIRTNPGVAMIYCDNDCMDEFGRRVYPVFKPEWNPELLMNGNYIGSVVMLTRHVLNNIGGWRHRFEDSAIYDLVLRAGGKLSTNAVLRIADILWHTRIADSKTGIFLTNGTRAPQVLYEYLENSNPLSQVSKNDSLIANATHEKIRDGQLETTLKVDRELSVPVPSVEIIIPNKNKVDILESCINSILRRTIYPEYQITVVDNGSEDVQTLEYYAELERHPVVKLLHHPGEFNYSALNNFAVAQSEADFVVLLNNDTEVISANWLNEMIAHGMQPETGCVGAKLYYSNNRVQHGGVIVGLKGMAGHAHRFLSRDADGYCGRLKMSQNVTAVTAACLAVRREVYQQIGGLNETDLKVAYNDVDFCLRCVEAGYRNIWTPYAELYHHESVSRGSEDTPQKKRRFQDEFDYMRRRWATDSWVDAAYNPNLAKDLEDFSLSA